MRCVSFCCLPYTITREGATGKENPGFTKSTIILPKFESDWAAYCYLSNITTCRTLRSHHDKHIALAQLGCKPTSLHLERYNHITTKHIALAQIRVHCVQHHCATITLRRTTSSIFSRRMPIVVFQKSHLDDLYQFAEKGIGLDLTFGQKMELCVETVIVTRDMHGNSKERE